MVLPYLFGARLVWSWCLHSYWLLTKINLVKYYFFCLGIPTNFTESYAVNKCSRSHTKTTVGAVPSEKVVACHHQRMKFCIVPFIPLLSDTAFTSCSSQQRINPGKKKKKRHNFLSRSTSLIISGSQLPWKQLREMGRNGKRKLQEEEGIKEQWSAGAVIS